MSRLVFPSKRSSSLIDGSFESFASDVAGSWDFDRRAGFEAFGPLLAEELVQLHVLATGSDRDEALRRYEKVEPAMLP